MNEYECANCKKRYKVTCDFKNFYLGDWKEVFTEEEILKQNRLVDEQHNEQIKKVVSKILEELKAGDELDFKEADDYKNPSNNINELFIPVNNNSFEQITNKELEEAIKNYDK